MANFFEGVENLLKHPIDEIKWIADETKGVVKPLLKGDVSESWDSFKGSFGRHNKMMEDITVPLGGRNKITENPDAAAGAILGSIFAAPLIGGAMGGGSGSGLGTTEFAQGALANKPKPSFNFSGFGKGDVSSYFTPDFENVGWKPGANNMQGGDEFNFLGDTYDKLKKEGVGKEPFDYELLGRTLSSIKPVNAPPVRHIGRSGGGGSFRYDKSLYENPLLTREFNALYSEPLYKKLT